jgi:hypothetical protein
MKRGETTGKYKKTSGREEIRLPANVVWNNSLQCLVKRTRRKWVVRVSFSSV